LGIDRQDSKITLTVSQDGLAWQKEHLTAAEGLLTVVLNIGCGTGGALPRRPPMQPLLDGMVALYRHRPFRLNLSGADFEAAVNAEFKGEFLQALAAQGLFCEVLDWSGQCSLSELTGLLAATDLVISSDSGPYHMAVALGLPTVCWLNFDTPPACHRQAGVAVVINPSPQEFVAAARTALELA
jgi:hypothetical protein